MILSLWIVIPFCVWNISSSVYDCAYVNRKYWKYLEKHVYAMNNEKKNSKEGNYVVIERAFVPRDDVYRCEN